MQACSPEVCDAMTHTTQLHATSHRHTHRDAPKVAYAVVHGRRRRRSCAKHLCGAMKRAARVPEIQRRDRVQPHVIQRKHVAAGRRRHTAEAPQQTQSPHSRKAATGVRAVAVTERERGRVRNEALGEDGVRIVVNLIDWFLCSRTLDTLRWIPVWRLAQSSAPLWEFAFHGS